MSDHSAALSAALARFADDLKRDLASSTERDTPREPVFHYTNQNAFKKIIQSETFWFISIYSMDDTAELNFGLALARELVAALRLAADPAPKLFLNELIDADTQERLRSLFEFYSVSFGPRDADELWSRYADYDGVAFGVAPAFFVPELTKPLKPEDHVYVGKVAYGTGAVDRHTPIINASVSVIEAQLRSGALRRENAQDFYRRLGSDVLVQILWNCVTTKDQLWSNQEEVRLLALNNLQSPHLEVHTTNERRRVEIPQPTLLQNISEVVLGSACTAAEELAMREFLDTHSLSHVPLRRSHHAARANDALTN